MIPHVKYELPSILVKEFSNEFDRIYDGIERVFAGHR